MLGTPSWQVWNHVDRKVASELCAIDGRRCDSVDRARVGSGGGQW